MRISDWSSDVCSSDLHHVALPVGHGAIQLERRIAGGQFTQTLDIMEAERGGEADADQPARFAPHRAEIPFRALQRVQHGAGVGQQAVGFGGGDQPAGGAVEEDRSEAHTSDLQSLMRISYAVFCLTKKTAKSTSPVLI